MVEMNDILDRLIERTAQGGVPWKPTADEETFAANFGNLSVLISKYRRGDLKLSVLDEKGTEIDFTNNSYDDLNDLHYSVKRRVLGTDERLAELMEALEGPA